MSDGRQKVLAQMAAIEQRARPNGARQVLVLVYDPETRLWFLWNGRPAGVVKGETMPKCQPETK